MVENKTIIIFDSKYKLFIKELNVNLLPIDAKFKYHTDYDVVDIQIDKDLGYDGNLEEFAYHNNQGFNIDIIADLEMRHTLIREYSNKNIHKLNLSKKVKKLKTPDHYAISVCILLENIDDYNSFDEILFEELFTKRHLQFDYVRKVKCGCGCPKCDSINMFQLSMKKTTKKIPTLIGSFCVKKFKIINEEEKKEVETICSAIKKELKEKEAKNKANKINYMRLAFNLWKKNIHPPIIYYQNCLPYSNLHLLYKKYNCKWDNEKILWYSKNYIPELRDLRFSPDN